MYSFGSTLPHFQQIPLTARHMLGKVFLSSLFLWHVMPFSPKKLWTDFFYYEKTWNGITCNLHMIFILPSGVFFCFLNSLRQCLSLIFFSHLKKANFCHFKFCHDSRNCFCFKSMYQMVYEKDEEHCHSFDMEYICISYRFDYHLPKVNLSF